jgi:putative ABC transport system permease protein
VIGSYVAQATGLRAGSTFNPYHGLIYDERQRHRDQYTVVGVLEATNSPSDRVIWIPIEGVYRMSGHVLRGAGETLRAAEGEEIPDEHKEVSAVMLKLRDPQSGFQHDQTINKQGKVATLAWPIGRVMADLFDKLGRTSPLHAPPDVRLRRIGSRRGVQGRLALQHLSNEGESGLDAAGID